MIDKAISPTLAFTLFLAVAALATLAFEEHDQILAYAVRYAAPLAS